MTKEQKFYNALKDIFVGAKVEGESGYINLMRIKSRYYEKGVFPKLQEDVEEAVKPFPDFKEELFDKLYTFFHRYFSESGSIYFRYTPLHQNIYEKVYTDDKDVMLFWKTHMLYYVKTDRLFKSLEVEIPPESPLDKGGIKGGYKFFFDVSTLEHKKANEKRETIYELKEIRKDGVISFNVYYTEKGRTTKLDEIIKSLRKAKVTVDEELLEKAFRVFEKQSEVDYFINKNAKEFLREQFNIWLYQYVFSGESEWNEKRIKQLQALKDIAFKIIDFISQFEDELVRIWNKPKFVLNSNYVITLDRIIKPSPLMESTSSIPSPLMGEGKGEGENWGLIEKILNHPHFNDQVKEWKKLGIVDDDFSPSVIANEVKQSQTLNPKYKFLPIDTKYFKDLELEILGMFDDLDNALDGWLIHSENYQALNTILPKFKEQVQTLYIDPPYNTGSDEFIYKDKYQDSSWLTMMENRLSLGIHFLDTFGNICSSINEVELYNFKNLKDSILDKSNYLANFIIKVRHEERILKGDKDVHEVTENLLYYRKSKEHKIAKKTLDNTSFDEYVWEVKILTKPIFIKEIGGKKVEIYKQGNYDFIKGTPSDTKLKRINIRGSIRQGNSSGRYYVRYLEPDFEKWRGFLFKVNGMGKDALGYRYFYIPDKSSRRNNGDYFQGLPLDIKDTKEIPYPNYIDMVDKFNRTGYEGPNYFGSGKKPEAFIGKVMELSNNLKGDLILDFFLGSGTTTAAVHKLGRKWIGIEMADYFEDCIIPRMKEVLAGRGNHEPCGISKEVNWPGGGFFKYYDLEQYEDTLRKVNYEDADLFENPSRDPYNQYIFLKDLKLLSALEIDYKKNKVKVDLNRLYDGIDIPETLSNLLGKWIKKITPDPSNPLRASFVEFEDGEKVNLKDLDYKLIKPLIWW